MTPPYLGTPPKIAKEARCSTCNERSVLVGRPAEEYDPKRNPRPIHSIIIKLCRICDAPTSDTLESLGFAPKEIPA